jgi:hypothetical protein
MSLRSHDPLEGVRAFGLSSRAALGVLASRLRDCCKSCATACGVVCSCNLGLLSLAARALPKTKATPKQSPEESALVDA